MHRTELPKALSLERMARRMRTGRLKMRRRYVLRGYLYHLHLQPPTHRDTHPSVLPPPAVQSGRIEEDASATVVNFTSGGAVTHGELPRDDPHGRCLVGLLQ